LQFESQKHILMIMWYGGLVVLALTKTFHQRFSQ